MPTVQAFDLTADFIVSSSIGRAAYGLVLDLIASQLTSQEKSVNPNNPDARHLAYPSTLYTTVVVITLLSLSSRAFVILANTSCGIADCVADCKS
jgi:hypothetical protein